MSTVLRLLLDLALGILGCWIFFAARWLNARRRILVRDWPRFHLTADDFTNDEVWHAEQLLHEGRSEQDTIQLIANGLNWVAPRRLMAMLLARSYVIGAMERRVVRALEGANMERKKEEVEG